MIKRLLRLITPEDRKDVVLINLLEDRQYEKALAHLRVDNKSIHELRRIASKLGIPYYSTLRKHVLISLINDRTNAEASSQVGD